MKDTKSARAGTPTKKRYAGFTTEEKSAMKQRVHEMKAGDEQGESDLQAKIAEMQESDRAMAKRIDAIIKASAPALTPRTYYGMPAYARDGKVVCFFKPAQKFKTRYATFEFNDVAKLDDGAMWPIGFALTKVSAAEEAKIGALIKKALS